MRNPSVRRVFDLEREPGPALLAWIERLASRYHARIEVADGSIVVIAPPDRAELVTAAVLECLHLRGCGARAQEGSAA